MTVLKRKVEKEEVYGYQCDICGHPCSRSTGEDDVFEWATLHGHWGFFSGKDQEDHECHMCEPCYDKVKEFIESLGGQVRVREYHLLTGRILKEE